MTTKTLAQRIADWKSMRPICTEHRHISKSEAHYCKDNHDPIAVRNHEADAIIDELVALLREVEGEA